MDKQTVRTICYLSRLSLDQNSAQKIESDLDVILSMIDELQEVDTSKLSQCSAL